MYTESSYRKIDSFFSDMVSDTFEKLASPLREGTIVPRAVVDTMTHIVRREKISRCVAGQKYAYVSSSGDFYPCQLYYASKSDRMNYDNGHLDFLKNVHDNKNMPECRDCFCRNFCLAWCPGASLGYNGHEYGVIPERCAAQKAITRSVIVRLAEAFLNENEWLILQTNLRTLIQRNSL